RGTDDPYSRRVWRRRKFRGPDRESARREGDRDGVDRESGFAEATRRGRGDRLHENEIRRRRERGRRRVRYGRARHAGKDVSAREERRIHYDNRCAPRSYAAREVRNPRQ